MQQHRLTQHRSLHHHLQYLRLQKLHPQQKMRDIDIRQKNDIKVERMQKHRAQRPHRSQFRPLHRQAEIINNNRNNIDNNESTMHMQPRISTTKQHLHTATARQHQMDKNE